MNGSVDHANGTKQPTFPASLVGEWARANLPSRSKKLWSQFHPVLQLEMINSGVRERHR